MEQGTSSLCHAGDEKYTRKIITFCKVSLRNSAFLGGTICGRTRKSFAVGERETQRLPKHIDTHGDTKGIFISLVCEFASQFASPFFPFRPEACKKHSSGPHWICMDLVKTNYATYLNA